MKCPDWDGGQVFDEPFEEHLEGHSISAVSSFKLHAFTFETVPDDKSAIYNINVFDEISNSSL